MGPWGTELPFPRWPGRVRQQYPLLLGPRHLPLGRRCPHRVAPASLPRTRLAELRRNPVLRRLVGIEAEEQVPHYSYPKWSRTADGI